MRVYLDTNIWVYAYENDPVFGPAAQSCMMRLHQGGHRIVSSLFVLNELLVVPTRRADEFTVAAYRRMFQSPVVEVIPFTIAATQRYAHLRAFGRVKALDALHLAVAAEAGVDHFLTQDQSLLAKQIEGIGSICDLSGDVS